jgi:16S rRNA (guanine527-N7)-methyltransferase
LSTPPPRLVEVLTDARARGLLGPGDPQAHIGHALAFARTAESEGGGPPAAVLDLGSGAGVPGLVLALEWPEARVLLLDAAQRRCAFLTEAAERLDVEARVEVWRGRAEVLAHDPALREHLPLVVARSFASPPVTAELAAGFLEVGGLLLVSEPPEPDPHRWSEEGLRSLGLGPASRGREAGSALVRIRKIGPMPDTRPRRTGIPGKRPLW